MQKKSWLLPSIALLSSLILVACGSDDDNDDSQNSATGTTINTLLSTKPMALF